MSWITLTTDDILQRLTSAETSAYGTAATAVTQTSVWATVLADVVREVRGYVAGHSANKLGDGSTIPDELKGAALALAVFYGASRLPIKITDARQKAYDAALVLLARVADGHFAIEQPAAISHEIITGASVQTATMRRRIASGNDLSGL